MTALRASPLGYVRVGVSAQLRRDDFVPQARFDQVGSNLVDLLAGLGPPGAQIVDFTCLLGDGGVTVQQLHLDPRRGLLGCDPALLGTLQVATQVGRLRLGVALRDDLRRR